MDEEPIVKHAPHCRVSSIITGTRAIGVAYGKGSAGSPLDLSQFTLTFASTTRGLSSLIPPIVAFFLPVSALASDERGRGV